MDDKARRTGSATQAEARLDRLCQRIGNRNQDLSGEEVEALADEISREAVDRLIQRGKVVYCDLCE